MADVPGEALADERLPDLMEKRGLAGAPHADHGSGLARKSDLTENAPFSSFGKRGC